MALSELANVIDRLVETHGIGSVIEYCIRHAYCPVVVVPPRLAIPDATADAVSATHGVH